jgi:conjugative transposon TraN protein
MKTIIENILGLVFVLGFHAHPNAQMVASNKSRLNLGKIDPYQIEVTYNKTTNLLFPAAVRYVDLGSEFIIADEPGDIKNLLRIKASVRDFEEETNFSVVTEDGRFYNFDVRYKSSPATMNYDLLKMQQITERGNDDNVLFEELGNSSPSLTGLLMQAIHKKNKRMIRHIHSKSYGVYFRLKGIYIHNGLLYFHTELSNKSNLPFKIDFITFKIADKKIAKRTVIQEKLLTPLRMYKPLDEIAGNATEQNVFLLDQFTLSDDKVLFIEIFEKNGGRQQRLRLGNMDLVRASLITDMYLKF